MLENLSPDQIDLLQKLVQADKDGHKGTFFLKDTGAPVRKILYYEDSNPPFEIQPVDKLNLEKLATEGFIIKEEGYTVNGGFRGKLTQAGIDAF